MSNYIMGRNCLLEVLRFKPERILKIYVLESKLEKKEKPCEIMDLIQKQKFPVEYTDKKKLSEMVFSDSHQGFVAELKPRDYLELKSFLKKIDEREGDRRNDKLLVVMLDTIMDPQNFGAILRATECFGVSALVFSKNRGTSLTPAVCKVGSGASELMEIIQVSNLAQTVKRFQEEGFEAVVADATEDGKELFSYKFSDKTLLVLGSEGKGVQPLIKKSADISLKIPLKGKIDSLNVSQAAAVFLAVMSNS